MKPSSINKICFQAALFPVLIVLLISLPIAISLFKTQIQDMCERELSRHELIQQLLLKAISSDIIIENDDAIYATLKAFKDKYNLQSIALVDNKPNEAFSFRKIISSKELFSFWPLKIGGSTQYVFINSKVEVPLASFAFSSILVLALLCAAAAIFIGIKQQLYLKIVNPLQHILNSGSNNAVSFNFNQAALEIANLHLRVNDYIKTLHQQRDAIEQHKIRSAEYDIALQVAHDIRSPALALEAISKLSTELKDENKTLIQNVTHRILEIADNILKAHMPLNSSPKSVGELVESLVNEKVACFSSDKISLRKIIDPRAHQIFLNIPEEKLARALSNILNNAYEAIDIQGLITVSVNIIDDEVQISVTDTGKGISAEHLDKVFEPNFTAGKLNGKGLGLAYVKDVIEKYDGTLSLKSIEKKSTELSIVFKY